MKFSVLVMPDRYYYDIDVETHVLYNVNIMSEDVKPFVQKYFEYSANNQSAEEVKEVVYKYVGQDYKVIIMGEMDDNVTSSSRIIVGNDISYRTDVFDSDKECADTTWQLYTKLIDEFLAVCRIAKSHLYPMICDTSYLCKAEDVISNFESETLVRQDAYPINLETLSREYKNAVFNRSDLMSDKWQGVLTEADDNVYEIRLCPKDRADSIFASPMFSASLSCDNTFFSYSFTNWYDNSLRDVVNSTKMMTVLDSHDYDNSNDIGDFDDCIDTVDDNIEYLV